MKVLIFPKIAQELIASPPKFIAVKCKDYKDEKDLVWFETKYLDNYPTLKAALLPEAIENKQETVYGEIEEIEKLLESESAKNDKDLRSRAVIKLNRLLEKKEAKPMKILQVAKRFGLMQLVSKCYAIFIR